MGSCPDTDIDPLKVGVDIDPFQIGCHGKIQKQRWKKKKEKHKNGKRKKIGKRKRSKWELIRQIKLFSLRYC